MGRVMCNSPSVYYCLNITDIFCFLWKLFVAYSHSLTALLIREDLTVLDPGSGRVLRNGMGNSVWALYPVGSNYLLGPLGPIHPGPWPIHLLGLVGPIDLGLVKAIHLGPAGPI